MSAPLIYQWAKAVNAALASGLAAAGTALLDGHITAYEWVGIGIAVTGAFSVVGLTTNALPDAAPAPGPQADPADVPPVAAPVQADRVPLAPAPELEPTIADYLDLPPMPAPDPAPPVVTLPAGPVMPDTDPHQGLTITGPPEGWPGPAAGDAPRPVPATIRRGAQPRPTARPRRPRSTS